MKKTLLTTTTVTLGILLLLMFVPWVAQSQEMVWKTNPTPLPTPTFWHSSISHNGKIYLIGPYGGGGEESPNVYFADVDSDGTVGSWHETTPLPEWREAAATVVWNTFVYVIGGGGPVWEGRSEQNTVYYASINPDGTIGSWESTTLLPERIVAAAGVVWNGRIYVAGGWNGFSRQDEVYFAEINEVDGSLGSWQTTTTLPLALNLMCAVAYNGVIYIIGGIHSHVAQSSAYYAIIDETDGTLGVWAVTTSLPEGRGRAGCALIGGSLYVIGGQTGHESATPEKTVYRTTIEAPGLGSWEELESLPEERREHSVATLDGRIYVMGGRDMEFSPRDTIYYSGVGSIAATIDVDPDTLNLASNGEWITAYIELPEGYSVDAIDVPTILLNGSISVDPEAPTEVGDYDVDGIPDLMVKFDRATVIEWLGTADYSEDTGKSVEVTLVITGKVAGTPFEGADTIRILSKG